MKQFVILTRVPGGEVLIPVEDILICKQVGDHTVIELRDTSAIEVKDTPYEIYKQILTTRVLT